MVALLRPKDVQVITKDGECVIAIQLDLNINVNTDGVVTGMSASASSGGSVRNKQEDDSVDWAIPDFKAKKPGNFSFGKQVEK